MIIIWNTVHKVPLQLLIKENAARLREDVQKLRDDLKQDHKRLVASEAHLRQLQESKQVANENAKDCLTELEKLREVVLTIAREKSNIEMELKFKERECQLLSEIKEDKAYNVQFLQHKIAKKRKKIKRLKEELESKECKLLSAQQEAQTWQEELVTALLARFGLLAGQTGVCTPCFLALLSIS